MEIAIKELWKQEQLCNTEKLQLFGNLRLSFVVITNVKYILFLFLEVALLSNIKKLVYPTLRFPQILCHAVLRYHQDNLLCCFALMAH